MLIRKGIIKFGPALLGNNSHKPGGLDLNN